MVPHDPAEYGAAGKAILHGEIIKSQLASLLRAEMGARRTALLCYDLGARMWATES
jgi:hypothetical protein